MNGETLLTIGICLTISTNVNCIFKGNGSFQVAGIFPLTNPHNQSQANFQNGVMLAEAMRFAVDKVNKKDYLHGYKLKIQNIYNCATEASVRERVLDTYLEAMQFLVGPYSSETSYFASILTDTFLLPSISYSATYSDFGRYGTMQRYMFRTVPSDEYRILAALNFIKQSEWTYVGMISSHGYDGERDSIEFKDKLSDFGACYSSQHNLPKFKIASTYEQAVERVIADVRLKVLVLFTSNEDSWHIFRVLKSKRLLNRFLILCIYGCVNYQDVLQGHEDIANNTLSMYLHNTEVENFKEYFLNLKPTNHAYANLYFNRFWENVFQCSLRRSTRRFYKKNCTGQEQLKDDVGYYPLTPVHTVLDAIYSIAHTLRLHIENLCNADFYKERGIVNKTTCIVDATDSHKNTDFIIKLLDKLVYSDGTLKIPHPGKLHFSPTKHSIIRYDISKYTYDGKRSNNKLIWHWSAKRGINTTAKKIEKEHSFKSAWFNENYSDIKHVGVCSSPCGVGEYMDHDQNYIKAKCCWECRLCPSNSIVVNNTCVKCDRTEKTDLLRQKCLALTVRQMTWGSNVISVIFILFAVIGLFLTISVALIFTKNNGNRIVRASGRDLCYTIMIGICLTFICPFVFLTETNKITCILRGALPGFSFLACYAPLFLKTNRIYRIFFSARVSVSRPSLVSSQSQFAALFGVLAVQVIVSIVWFSSQVPVPEAIVSEDLSYVTIHCSSDSNPLLLVLNLSLSVIFMVCCTVLAFKTRHFPKNYNEAKYIGITLYITCVVWSLFLPIFFLIRYVETDFLKEYLMCIVCILIGFITLFGMFGPKVLMIYQAPPPTSSQGSLPTWYVTNSKDNEEDKELENTAFTQIS